MRKLGFYAIAGLLAAALLATAAYKYHDAVYSAGYNAGFADCNMQALAAAEKKRVEDQAKIDDIRKRADTELAARVSTNVKKALEDARKADPDCKPIVPRSVVDELRRGPK